MAGRVGPGCSGMAEVLEFRVPTGSAKTLLVWGLEPGLEHSLFSVFSKFGPLYSVRAHRNAAVAGPGYYAIIKFYSAGDASRAQHMCNGQRLFQKSPLKVCVCTKQKGFQQQVLALNSNKCQELANHYLGFNGWSSRIIALQNVSGFDGENEELGKTLQKRSVKYLCAVEVTLPNHGVCTRGVGLSKADVENSEDPLEFVTASRVQKLAVRKALSSAFQKILLVVLGQTLMGSGQCCEPHFAERGLASARFLPWVLEHVLSKENGKVAVEYSSTQEELMDSLTEEELKGLLQVSKSSLKQFDLEEEEVLSDLSFDDELPSREMPSN